MPVMDCIGTQNALVIRPMMWMESVGCSTPPMVAAAGDRAGERFIFAALCELYS